MYKFDIYLLNEDKHYIFKSEQQAKDFVNKNDNCGFGVITDLELFLKNYIDKCIFM